LGRNLTDLLYNISSFFVNINLMNLNYNLRYFKAHGHVNYTVVNSEELSLIKRTNYCVPYATKSHLSSNIVVRYSYLL
jgi:hypothetical protein